MHFDDTVNPAELPAPPSACEVARRFDGPIFTLAPQPAIEEAGAGTMSQTQDGQLVMEQAALSYTVWRNPVDRDDPANLDDNPAMQAQLDIPPIRPLAPWMQETRRRMRYPWLWEAVRTTRVHVSEAAPWHSFAFELVSHVNYVVRNRFRDERIRGGMPGELLGAATEAAIERGIPVEIDGALVDGAQIDTDAHVFALGADLGDRVLTAVLPREYLGMIRVAFVTHE